MNLLICGGGKGSWEIRGEQLGAACGARVSANPSQADFAWADFCVLVKRHGARYRPAAQAARKPYVWDALDCWRQPWDNALGPQAAQAALLRQAIEVQAEETIGATEAQARALGGVYLPHHSRAGLTPAPACRELRVVAYEGNPAYLGVWARRLADTCARRGLAFVVNPPDLRRADVVVAFRDGQWDGWACRQWKSGVKLVNALAAGRPVLTQRTAAFEEIAPPGSCVETEAELDAALARWAPSDARAQAAEQCARQAQAYTLATVAEQYRRILERTEERSRLCTAV